MKVVLASLNPGKVAEFQALLAPLAIHLIPQSSLGIPEVEETGRTFIENALIKARHASRIAKMPALADDSGLAIAALNGAPGIYSARYAGKNAQAEDNIQKVLSELQQVPDEKRQASFHCALVFLLNELDPIPLVCDGVWKGKILFAPQGSDGFGYDPIFYVPSEKKSAAELPKILKNKISHRGLALQQLIKQLPDKLCMPSLSKI